MRVLYATLRDVRREIEIDDETAPNETEDAFIVETALPHVSERIEKITGIVFAPFKKARKYHAFGNHIDDLYDALDVGWTPILSVDSLSIGGVVIDPDDYFLLDADAGIPRLIALTYGTGVAWGNYGIGDWRNAIEVDGIWGHRYDYPEQGWSDSGQTVLNDPLAIDDSTITVTDDAVFSVGHMLQIEDEWLLVLAIEANTLTVQREVRGSTAAVHAATTPISIWRANEQIVRAASRWAAYLYRRKANFADTQKSEFSGTVIEKLPPDAPNEVANIINQFVYGISAGE